MSRNAAPRHLGAETTRPRNRAAAGPASVIIPTDLAGVFRNVQGVAVDERGVALSFAELKAKDDERFTEVLGVAPESPAELLKAVALDPRFSMDVRMKAANQAAPYFDMKMPLRVEGEMEHSGSLVDGAKLAAMSKLERETLLKMLKKLGVSL